MQDTKRGYARPAAALIALFPCLYSILFSKWISVELLYQSSSATLWQIGKVLQNVADFADSYGVEKLSGPLTAASLLTYTLLIAALVTMLLTIRSILHAFQSGGAVSSAGFWGAIALSGIVVILVWGMNSSISKETEGWIEDIFKLQTAPKLTLLCAIAGCICCKYIPEQALSNVTLPKVDLASVEQNAQAAAEKMGAAISRLDTSKLSMPKQAGETCAFCGKRGLEQDYRFCPYCGRERITKRFCEECGKELDITMQFCPYCGTAVRKEDL